MKTGDVKSLLSEATAARCVTRRMPDRLKAELRSSHAGELGAVWIYRGILVASVKPEIRMFAKQHMATEKAHLRLFEDLIHLYRGSLLLPLWVLAGFLTGFLPALFGKRGVYVTIEAVESFVSQHYLAQIKMLKHYPEWAPLEALLRTCLNDEEMHRRDAATRVEGTSKATKLWAKTIAWGSSAAVSISKKL